MQGGVVVYVTYPAKGYFLAMGLIERRRLRSAHYDFERVCNNLTVMHGPAHYETTVYKHNVSPNHVSLC